MTTLEREKRVLRLIANRYRKKGYSFYERPSRDLLPDFMNEFQPDAVALGEPKNIAIEIKSGVRGANDPQWKAISRLFEGRTDWELHVVLADETETDELAVQVSSLAVIDREVHEAAELAAKGHHRAAFVLAWAALEAISAADATAAPDGERGSAVTSTRTARELIALLEGSGRISFEQAVDLRTLIPLRNAVFHGDFSREVGKADADTVLGIAQSALQNA